MGPKDEHEYDLKLTDILNNSEFMELYDIKGNNIGMLDPETRERAVMCMADYCLNAWSTKLPDTKHYYPKPKGAIVRMTDNNKNTTLVEITEENTYDRYGRKNGFKRGMRNLSASPDNMSFSTPYMTIYNAEQSYRYYLKKYPKGIYAVDALLGISKCSMLQDDHLEARVSYEYALRTAMESKGFDKETINEIAPDAASKLFSLAKESKKLDVVFEYHYSNSPLVDRNYVTIKPEKDKNKVTVNVHYSNPDGSKKNKLTENILERTDNLEVTR